MRAGVGLLAGLIAGCGQEILLISAPTPTPEPDPVPVGGGDDGFDAPPGAGHVFVVNQLGFAEYRRGFDLDGKCSERGCIDNALAPLGELWNDQLRLALLGGERLLLVELAGVDPTEYRGRDSAVTFKVYEGVDADSPYFPANNFKVPPGSTSCCTFKVRGGAMSGSPPQAKSRVQGSIDQALFSTSQPGRVDLPANTSSIGMYLDSFDLRMAQMSVRVPSGLDELNEGLIGGVTSLAALYRTTNPYCRTVSPACPTRIQAPRLLDLVVSLLGQPDIDVDGDGRECVYDTEGDGELDLCCDGEPESTCSGSCRGQVIPPVDPARPASCVLDPRMADGYSVAYTFTAVRGSIVGVAP